MHPAALLIGGGLAAVLWLASRSKQEPTEFVMRAGQWYAVTLDIDDDDDIDAVATKIGQAGGILDLDSPDGTLKFEMRPGIDLPVKVPGALPGVNSDVIITEIRKIDR